jgi:ubiquinone/menaquinone biosynthesis C-methylase UbiE
MNSSNKNTNLYYWEKFVKTKNPIVKDWLKKENLYLKNNIKKDSIVLDVGCGFGRNIKFFANKAKKIVAIDNDKGLFGKIKKNLSKYKNVEACLCDVKKMPFDSNFFDYVICMGATFDNFSTNKKKALKEIKRVTKKSGKIIISVYSENALTDRLKEYKRIVGKGKHIKKIVDGTVYFDDGFIVSEQFTKNELEKLFRSVGFKKIKITKLNRISYLCELTV